MLLKLSFFFIKQPNSISTNLSQKLSKMNSKTASQQKTQSSSDASDNNIPDYYKGGADSVSRPNCVVA
ncbi:unnamed protein product [Ambrosiozyma monospora]|uniref:Unnamed protein product n=1 Tax=Ambrosiozyma monospora TaxID=43982 RepID=A0ACB5T0Q7_AMBMO|nr:unnamed protein product [Ambrosiozyma monospora]